MNVSCLFTLNKVNDVEDGSLSHKRVKRDLPVIKILIINIHSKM